MDCINHRNHNRHEWERDRFAVRHSRHISAVSNTDAGRGGFGVLFRLAGFGQYPAPEYPAHRAHIIHGNPGHISKRHNIANMERRGGGYECYQKLCHPKLNFYGQQHLGFMVYAGNRSHNCQLSTINFQLFLHS